MIRYILSGRVTPDDKAAHDYHYVPFDLPTEVRRLTVRYRYSARMSHDRVEGGNVIDIGLFDPRGNEFPGGAGFRGWSGSDRLEFTITPDDATPGYLAGPLPAGRYQVILGLYRIWPAGADYEIEIEAEEDGPTAADDTGHPAIGRLPASGPIPTGSAIPPSLWLRGDLQSHTYHSDGRGSPGQLVEKARALGLDFLAVTDHNTISHHPSLLALADETLLLIPGQEVTTYYGHMNVWGTGRWCDFRCRTDAEMTAVISLAHNSGGICSVNHPKTGGPAWEYNPALPVDAMEVWQGPWPNHNDESLALWDGLLRSGHRRPAVGGSDYHCPSGPETGWLRLGQPTTWLWVTERSIPALLEAIQAGRACISAAPDGPRLNLAAVAGGRTAVMGGRLSLPTGDQAQVTAHIHQGDGLTLRLITEQGLAYETLLDARTTSVQVSLGATRYVRAELVGDMPADRLPADAPADLDRKQWRWALSNPIYIDRPEPDNGQ